jgi:ribonuclease BN (tRNA processing enzyme)
MTLRFTVLASGSAGNAALLEFDHFGLLLDVGLGPRQLSWRLAALGANWDCVHAVLLTHTHSDHWRNPTLAHLSRRRIPLYCHAEHHETLHAYGPAFSRLHEQNLVRCYDGAEFTVGPGLRCRALPLRHDSGATFGFRFQVAGDLYAEACALAYAADLGCWDDELAQQLADVDVLALEFNHDVEMEYASGRSPYLIARVLGDRGHLSNEQAASLLQEVLRRSVPGRLQHLVQLHLSRDCNRPQLAIDAARQILDAVTPAISLHTASQHETGATIAIGPETDVRPSIAAPRGKARTARRSPAAMPLHAALPGLEI